MKQIKILNELGRNYIKSVKYLTPNVKPLIISLLKKEDKNLIYLLDKEEDEILKYLTSNTKYVLSQVLVERHINNLIYDIILSNCENPKIMLKFTDNNIYIIKYIGFSRKQICDFLKIDIDLDFLKKFTENNIVSVINKLNKNKKIEVCNNVKKSETVNVYYVNVTYKLPITISELMKGYNFVEDKIIIKDSIMKEIEKIIKELNCLQENVNNTYKSI